jgi:hypothetical protein
MDGNFRGTPKPIEGFGRVKIDQLIKIWRERAKYLEDTVDIGCDQSEYCRAQIISYTRCANELEKAINENT